MTDGRWPANVILSPGMANALDGQSGTMRARGNTTPTKRDSAFWGGANASESKDVQSGDSGGASRFFLTAGYEPWELEWIIANGLTPCGT